MNKTVKFNRLPNNVRQFFLSDRRIDEVVSYDAGFIAGVEDGDLKAIGTKYHRLNRQDYTVGPVEYPVTAPEDEAPGRLAGFILRKGQIERVVA